MAEGDDDSQKTEEPTRKRLEDAYENGQTPNSRETSSFFMLFTFTLLLSYIAPGAMHHVTDLVAAFIQQPESFAMDNNSVFLLCIDIVQKLGMVLILPFAAFIATIFAANTVQNRFVLSLEPLVPKLEKISIGKGLERLFSMRALAEFFKGIIKLVVVAYIAYAAVAPYFGHLKQLPDSSIGGTLAYLMTLSHRMLVGICIVMFFIAIVDFIYQRFEFMKGLRMSKQEIRDEYKQQEGDPQVKNRLRQVRMERARKRMMSAVPTADVIVTNPTHYSVALKYAPDEMRAPKVVAKGADNIALRIREIARENDIPLYENVALAQALYATVDIDREIPAEHYKAVAEVITYVYRIKGKFAQSPR